MGKFLCIFHCWPFFVVIWISWGHSHIFIEPWCCDVLPWWVVLTEIKWKWGCYTADYGCSLLMWRIKWFPVPSLVLGQTIRAVLPLCFSHSNMSSVVAVRLGSFFTPHLFGGLSLIHSQEEGPHFASIYPLFATNIYLLYGLTTGPCWVTLYPVALSRLSLLFKKLNSLPSSPWCFIIVWYVLNL